MARRLRAPGPLELIDRSVFVARSLPARWIVRAWVASLLPAATVIAIYVIERVEGVRSARPLLACLLVAALLARPLLLRPVVRACVESVGMRGADTVDVVALLRLAAIVLFGVWCWAWPLLGLVKLSPYALVVASPVFALRALGAPSWLARVVCAEPAGGGGLAAYRIAFRDLDGVRGAFVVAELLVVLGALGLFANLFALLAVVLLLGHSLLGLDVAFTAAFMSPDNPFVLLLVGAITFVLLEPVRVALSALAYVGGVARRDGGDLDRAIDAVVVSQQSGARNASVGAIVGVCFVVMTFAASVSAQEADSGEIPVRDQQVQDRVEQILTRREFVELATTDHSSLARVIEGWLRELREWFETDRDTAAESPKFVFHRPSPWVVLCLALMLLAAFAVYVYRSRGRDRSALGDTSDATLVRIDLASAPSRLLEDADSLARRGDFAAALRALYVATIVSLHRRGLIALEPSTTNWQYQRQLPRGELRGAFADFTRVFDQKHYGEQATTSDEYVACRGLAALLCGGSERTP